MACYGRLAEKIDALIWPTLTYGHYPAFVEYAGSSNLSSTVRGAGEQIAGQILGDGCPNLFVLDTGISTQAPVERALARLAMRASQASVDPRRTKLSRALPGWPSSAMAAMPTNWRRR